MPVYAELGDSLSLITVETIQTNNILTGAVQKYIQDVDDESFIWTFWWCGKKQKIDGHYYPALMHGPEKRCRYILTGNQQDRFITQSSAEQAAELLLKYTRQLEPVPEGYYPMEEQPLLFDGEALPFQFKM